MEIDITELLKDERGGSLFAGYDRVSIFDILNENIKIKKVVFGEDEYGEYVVFYTDDGLAIKSKSQVLMRQLKQVADFLENNPDSVVKARVVKPKGKKYFTLEKWAEE